MSPILTKRGILTVESVLGILILSVVGIVGGIALIKASQSITHIRMAKKAAVLGEMVLERYKASAVSDFSHLAVNNDVIDQPVRTFLNDPGLSGNFFLTTQTTCTADENCLVKATLHWNDPKGPSSIVLEKTFARASPVIPGKKVIVFVKAPPCNETTEVGISSNCLNGLRGFTITSFCSNGTPVQSLTDGDGRAILEGVASDAAVVFIATAPVPSPFDSGLVGFSTGYYHVRGDGATVVTDSTTVDTTSDSPVVLFKDFHAAGSIQGNVVDAFNQPLGNRAQGMRIQLLEPAIVMRDATINASSTRSCTIGDPCIVSADANGQYVFNNVMPTTDVNLIVRGINGTIPYDPYIGPTSPVFVQGYVNTSTVTRTSSEWGSSTGPVMTQDLMVHKKGSLLITVKDKATGNPITDPDLLSYLNVMIDMSYPDGYSRYGWRSDNLNIKISTGVVGPTSNQRWVNNFISQEGQFNGKVPKPNFLAWITPPAGAPGANCRPMGISGQADPVCFPTWFGITPQEDAGNWKICSSNCLGDVTNPIPVDILMEPTYRFHGTIKDSGGFGVYPATCNTLIMNTSVGNLPKFKTDGSGNYDVWGFEPKLWSGASYPTASRVWMNVNTPSSRLTTMVVTGREVSNGNTSSSRRAGELVIAVRLWGPGGSYLQNYTTSGADGTVSITATFDTSQSVGNFNTDSTPPILICDNPTPHECEANFTLPIPGCSSIQSPSPRFYVHTCNTCTGGGPFTPAATYTYQTILKSYYVYGTVRDAATGRGIRDIKILDWVDPNHRTVATTNGSGYYSGDAWTNNNNYTLAIAVPGQQLPNGQNYVASDPDYEIMTYYLPPTLTPVTGRQIDFSMIQTQNQQPSF
jgi:hypothetical protein